MKAVIQRVSSASVHVNGCITGSIEHGWLILLGIKQDDKPETSKIIANKVAKLRAFNDEHGKMNLDIKQVSGSVLVVSQFTLYGDCQKGRRPSFKNAAAPERAQELYLKFVTDLKDLGLRVATGQFGANMQIKMQGDGPVTLILEN